MFCSAPGNDPTNFFGQYVQGAFLATGTSESLRLATNGFGNAHFNALLVQEVPEPSTLALAVLGSLGLLAMGRRRRP